MFPYTLDFHAAVWYHIFLIKSIHSWGMFKHMFLKKFTNDMTQAMLFKEFDSMKMEAKEKLKYFN